MNIIGRYFYLILTFFAITIVCLLSSNATADVAAARAWNTFELSYPQEAKPVMLANIFALPVNMVDRSIRSDSCNLRIPKLANITLSIKPEDEGKNLTFKALGNSQFRFVVLDPDQQYHCGARADRLYGIPTFSIEQLKAGTYQIYLAHELKARGYFQVFIERQASVSANEDFLRAKFQQDELPTWSDIDSAIFTKDSDSYQSIVDKLTQAEAGGSAAASCLLAYTAMSSFDGKPNIRKSKELVDRHPKNTLCQRARVIHLINSFTGGFEGTGTLNAADDLMKSLASGADENGGDSLFYGDLLHNSLFGANRASEGYAWVEKSARTGNLYAIDFLRHIEASYLSEQNINPMHRSKKPEKKEPGFWDGFGGALLESAPVILGTLGEALAQKQAIEMQQSQMRLEVAQQETRRKAQYATSDKQLVDLDNRRVLPNTQPVQVKPTVENRRVAPQVVQSHSKPANTLTLKSPTQKNPVIAPVHAPTVLEFNNPQGWHKGDTSESQKAGDLLVSLQIKPAVEGKINVLVSYCNEGSTVWRGGARTSEIPPTRTHASETVQAGACSNSLDVMNAGTGTIYVLLQQEKN